MTARDTILLSRIQFTPDLLPADITGTEDYYQEGGKLDEVVKQVAVA